MTNPSKPPVWFWLLSALALVWNLMGVGNYLAQVYATPEMIPAMPDHQREYMQNTPSWVIGCFAVAVFGGSLACLFLLLRRTLALPIAIISLIGIIGQVSHSLLLSNAIEVYGPGGMVLPALITLIGIGLVFLSKKSITRQWLK